MKVLVCGSRTWTDKETMRLVLEKLYMDTMQHLEIVHGAAIGADKLAMEIALEHGWTEIAYYPDWKTYGRAAGFKRNVTMLDKEKPALVIAFWDGKSNGTRHTIEQAKKRGIPIEIHLP